MNESQDNQEKLIESLNNDIFLLQEDLRQLELMFNDPEWRQLTLQSSQDFSREGLRQITELARIMEKANPTIKRGVEVQRLYVWAQGIMIQAKNPEINQVIQDFVMDERNQASFFGQMARKMRETRLQTDGNMFIRFFINEANGRVRVAIVDAQQMQEIITNPDDANEPWFYHRKWSRKELGGNERQQEEIYRDWQYMPKVINAPFYVEEKTPIYHVASNQLGLWGLCEFFPAIAWAMAYKTFLENLASVWQALARFAWKLQTKGGKRGVAAAKTKLNTTASTTSGETNPPPLTASTFIGSDSIEMQPVKTGGATMKADDGRRLFLMAASAFGYPETFWGDVSVGTLATAKSLDRPTELKFIDRQELWLEVYNSIFRFVLKWAVKAPNGPLKGLGRVEVVPDGDEVSEFVVWNEGVDPTVMVQFPPIVEEDVPELVDAWVSATTLNGQLPAGTFDLETFTREVSVLLGVDDIDQLMMELFPDDGSVTQEARLVLATLEKLLADLDASNVHGMLNTKDEHVLVAEIKKAIISKEGGALLENLVNSYDGALKKIKREKNGTMIDGN